MKEQGGLVRLLYAEEDDGEDVGKARPCVRLRRSGAHRCLQDTRPGLERGAYEQGRAATMPSRKSPPSSYQLVEVAEEVRSACR